jgi:hypothetical protein
MRYPEEMGSAYSAHTLCHHHRHESKTRSNESGHREVPISDAAMSYFSPYLPNRRIQPRILLRFVDPQTSRNEPNTLNERRTLLKRAKPIHLATNGRLLGEFVLALVCSSERENNQGKSVDTQ